MKLYFRSSNGNERIIAEVESEESVMKHIHAFVDDCNKKRTDGKQFKIYYIRSWGSLDEGDITYDISSHSEFFIL